MSLLHPTSPERCHEPCCAPEAIARDNLVLAETTDIDVRCPRCTNTFTASLARVHRKHGMSLCPRCHRKVDPPATVDIFNAPKEN